MAEFEGNLIALPALRRLEALMPRGIDSVHKTTLKALEQDDYSRALKLANERYARRGVEDYDTVLTYACLLVGRELVVEARGLVKKAREAHGDDPALMAILADARVLEGEVDAAKEALRQIDAEAIDRPEILAFVADVWLDLAEEDEAIAFYQRAVDRDVGDPEPAIRLAQLYMGRDELWAAAEAFEYAAKLAKDRLGLWEACADLWFELGEERRGLKAQLRLYELGEADADAWVELGIGCAQFGEFQDALEALSEAEKVDPFCADALIVRGHVFLELGRAEEAMAAFKQAEKLRGERAASARGMAEAALLIGDLMLARQKAERAVELSDDDPESHHVQSRVHQQFGRHDEALASVERALELEPGQPIYMTSKALSLASLGRVDEAKAALEEAVEAAQAHPEQLPMWLDHRAWSRLEGRVEGDDWAEIGGMLEVLGSEG